MPTSIKPFKSYLIKLILLKPTDNIGLGKYIFLLKLALLFFQLPVHVGIILSLDNFDINIIILQEQPRNFKQKIVIKAQSQTQFCQTGQRLKQ